MAKNVAVDSLRPDRTLELIVAGLNALEGRDPRVIDHDLWHEVRSIVGGIVPAVHWPTHEQPPKRERGIGLLSNPITEPLPEWSAGRFNRLVRRSGLQLALRVDGEQIAPLVHQPTAQARVTWALWWCFYLGELNRLRRCQEKGCGRWFRDATHPRNQRRCSPRCTRRENMRKYRHKKQMKALRPGQSTRRT